MAIHDTSRLHLGIITLLTIMMIAGCDHRLIEPAGPRGVKDETTEKAGEIKISPLSYEQYRFAFNPPRKNAHGLKSDPHMAVYDQVSYGCVISTLNRSGADHPYSYHPYELTFPESIIEEAGGKGRIQIFIISNEEAGGHAQSFLDNEKVVRVARCRIPATDEAAALLDTYLRNFSGDSWLAANQKYISTGEVKDGQTIATLGGSYRWVCTKEGTAHKWIYDDEDQRWWLVVTPTCLEGYYEFVEEDSPMDGGGPGGGGDDPSPPCDDPTQLCVDGPGGSSGLDEDEIREDEVKRLLEDDAFALLDIPCEEIPKWQELAQYEIPQSVLDRLVNTDALSGSFIQKLEDASGAVVNMDNFSVTVPGNEIPNNWTAEEYLDHIRTNINDYVDGSTFEFYPVLPGEEEKWTEDPLGTLFSIQLVENAPWLDDGTVVASGYGSSFWLFTTVYAPEDNWHPVSGNRLFGVTDNGNGSYTFYTKGVDRLTTRVDQWAQSFFGIPFNSADDLWSSFQDLISDDFDNATIEDVITYRPDYEQVEDVLNGDAPIANLGCN